MQFNYHQNVRTNIAVVTFTNFNISRVAVKERLFNSFRKIGGNNPLFELEWIFPSFITSQVIQEIIHNTCFVCGGLMKDSQALENTWVGLEDFGKDFGQRGTTMSKIGQPVMKVVRKCSSCGHSHT